MPAPTFTDHLIPAGLQQFMESPEQGASQGSLCILAGGALYYVTSAQVGVAEATENLWILKSTDGGSTWAKVYDGKNGLTGIWVFAVQVIGSLIYIAAQEINATGFALMRWNTATDSFLSNAASVPDASSSNVPISLGAFADGSLLAVYVTDAGSVTVANHYVSGTDSWGVAQIVNTPGNVYAPIALAVQSSVDRAFVFLVNASTPFDVQVISITNPTTLGTIQQVLAATANADAFTQYPYYAGFPVIWNGDAELVFPYLDPGDINNPNPNVLTVFRAAVADNPVFTQETVEGSLGAGLDVTTFPSAAGTAAALLEIGGVLYCCYMVDNDQGSVGGAASQSWVYYRTNAGAGLGWSARTAAFASAIPNEPQSLYPVTLSGTNQGLLFGLIDPTQFFGPATKYDSLSLHFLGISESVGPELSITCGAPPDGILGNSYSHTFPASGGAPPYSFDLTVGALPPALTLDPATGIVSGILTTPGTFGFTIRVTDADLAEASVTCSITVLPASFTVVLEGVKRYPPGEKPAMVELAQPAHVKRAV